MTQQVHMYSQNSEYHNFGISYLRSLSVPSSAQWKGKPTNLPTISFSAFKCVPTKCKIANTLESHPGFLNITQSLTFFLRYTYF